MCVPVLLASVDRLPGLWPGVGVVRCGDRSLPSVVVVAFVGVCMPGFSVVRALVFPFAWVVVT